MSEHPRFQSMDEYFASVPAEAREILIRIRAIVERVAPAAKPTISYRMPAFRADRTFIYFAAFKNHIGIYPPVSGDEALLAELAPYRGEKGNLKFPLDEPVPYDLIERVAKALSGQYGKKEIERA